MTKGGRNLVILGLVSIAVALVTTTASLAFYRSSGDIYLDRSRPGYLPDEEEASEEIDNPEGEYDFSQTGPINTEVLDEYIENLQVEIDAIEKYVEPFSAGALSDEKLGI